MKPNYATIITAIIPEQVASLRQYLHAHAEPRPGGPSNFLQCQPLFRFDRINGLHFCSFVILDGCNEFAPRLVFEATFDGPQKDFLQELWRVAPAGMHAVYRNCVGYPQSGLNVPALIEDYLVRHDVGAHTYFSGCPGRSVAQIQGEGQLRTDLVTFLSRPAGTSNAPPDTLGDLQQTIQRDFVRGRTENRWAEQPAVVPWEMRHRDWVTLGAIVAVLAIACMLGVLVLGALFGMMPTALHDLIKQAFHAAWNAGRELTEPGASNWQWLGRLVSELQLPILPLVLVLAAAWTVVRLVELVLSAVTENPRAQYFILRFPLHIMVILRYALPIFLLGFVALGIVGNGPSTPERSARPSQVKIYVDKLDQKLAPSANVQEGETPSRLASFLMLLVLAVVLIALFHWATSLKLAVQFQMLSPMAENWRLFVLDAVRFAVVVVAVVAVLVVARHIPPAALLATKTFVTLITYVVLALTAFVVIGILAGYALAFVLLLVVRTLERADLRNFKSAADLAVHQHGNSRAYAREEGGINRYQNHLASLTYVKPGFLRRWYLRATLFVINLLSRFWFNRGELGGIPTILSARWVLIDRGRRLLFLDNYGGAWNSYLNEFIDMGAVKGLNAIWSNSYVKTADATKYAFPASRYYFWQGAQAERPFKAYVRQSQVETIVWYSAYPALSITNINMSTDLRQSLFKQLSDSDLDPVVHRL